MSEFFNPGVVLIGLFSAAAYTIYTFIKATHLERMAKIEKGLDKSESIGRSTYLELKLGMLMVGIALGLLLAYFLEQIMGLRGEVFYPSFMLLFGGISLIGSFFLVKYLNTKK